MTADPMLLDEAQHAAALERLAVRALAEGEVAAAWRYADRRCRIAPVAKAHHFTLRAEASHRTGAHVEALSDLSRALELAPDDFRGTLERLEPCDGGGPWLPAADCHAMTILAAADSADAFAAMWADLRRPELRPFEGLFFECYARAAQGEEPFNRMLPQAVDGWLAAVDEQTAGAADPAMVRLGLAVSRGLLLDLAATNDDDAVDAAAARFVAMLRRRR